MVVVGYEYGLLASLIFSMRIDDDGGGGSSVGAGVVRNRDETQVLTLAWVGRRVGSG